MLLIASTYLLESRCLAPGSLDSIHQIEWGSVDGASQIWCIAVLVRVSLSFSGLSDLPMPLIYMLFCFVIISRPLAGFVASEFW